MEIYNTIKTLTGKTAIALGFFDGVHLAHQEVIKAVIGAKSRGLVPTVMTFSIANSAPPNKLNIKTILTDEQKFIELQKLGVCQVVNPNFSEIDGIEPTEYFEEFLVKRLQVAEISCGYDYTFGKSAKGNIVLLRELCHKYNVGLTVLPKFQRDGFTISSTKIRECINDGDIPTANELLGYEYYTYGKVQYGNKIGNTIGFPTINQSLSVSQVIPKYGVYKTTTCIDGRVYNSMTNVGVKPTIQGFRLPLAETYIVGYEGNAYGKIAKVCYSKMLREEKKFSSVDELKQAIANDIKSLKE
ncbi:MAG: riboflavin biosynthesis protein RibF [Oscillospiraceae bacterium]